MTTFDEVINFYKSFNRYKNNTYEELYYHIEQPINQINTKYLKIKKYMVLLIGLWLIKKQKNIF